MPLESGKSKAAFSHNVEVEVNAGKPQKQAVAIAYSKARGDKEVIIDAARMTAAAAGYMELPNAIKEADCAIVQVPGGVSCDLGCCNEFSPQPTVAQFRCGTCKHVRDRARDKGAMDSATVGMAFDRSSLRTKDINGWLHIRDCRISKANVCPYLGREIPHSEKLGLVADRVYYLYRDAAALSAATFTAERIPLMLEHLAVTAETAQQREVKRKLVGAVSNARWMPPYLVADITVWDGEGIEAIESERQTELSPGYNYRPEMLSGVILGERYDGRMLDIIFNHLCLVDTGRTGPDVAVNDRAIPVT